MHAVRLDCAVDNAFLNNYYDLLGYKMVGTCQDGTYIVLAIDEKKFLFDNFRLIKHKVSL